MVVPGHALRLRQVQILCRELERGAWVRLTDERTLNFLPRRLARRNRIAACRLQRAAPFFQLLLIDENVGYAAPQIDADAIARLEQRETTARGSFGRRIEYRGRS